MNVLQLRARNWYVARDFDAPGIDMGNSLKRSVPNDTDAVCPCFFMLLHNLSNCIIHVAVFVFMDLYACRDAVYICLPHER